MDHKSTKQETYRDIQKPWEEDHKEEEPWWDDYKEIYRREIKAKYENWMPEENQRRLYVS